MLASLRCSSRAVYVSKTAIHDAAALASAASDLEAEFLRLADVLRSTSTDLTRCNL